MSATCRRSPGSTSAIARRPSSWRSSRATRIRSAHRRRPALRHADRRAQRDPATTVPDAGQLAAAAKQIHAKLDEQWRGVATVRRDPQDALDVFVPIRALGDWVQVRQRLGGVPAIKSVVVRTARIRSRRAASGIFRHHRASCSAHWPRPGWRSTRKPTSGDCRCGDRRARGLRNDRDGRPAAGGSGWRRPPSFCCCCGC